MPKVSPKENGKAGAEAGAEGSGGMEARVDGWMDEGVVVAAKCGGNEMGKAKELLKRERLWIYFPFFPYRGKKKKTKMKKKSE